jgi:WD40 repeat protein
LVTRGGVVSRWDPATRTTEVLLSEGVAQTVALGDGRHLVIADEGTWERWILDLEDGSRTPFPTAHRDYSDWGVDPTGTIIITGHNDGEIRVGPIFDGEPHVLFGHGIGAPKIFRSPDGRWIASIGGEGTLHLWPMPDVTKRPFHTLPYDELMAKLEAFTNLRAVPDAKSYTGYSIEPDWTAYRGWAEVPEW